MIDLDDFKSVNDGLGHAGGDVVLREVGRRLAAAVRTEDTLARFGGDEFALLCTSAADEQVAVAIARPAAGGVLAAVGRRRVAADGHRQRRSGADLASQDRPPSAEALLREADIALYRAKDHGGGRVELFDQQLQAQAQARLQLETELRAAIDQQRADPALPADPLHRRTSRCSASRR